MQQMDLNLLRVFDVLIQERSVTRTALRIGRSQSAVSHAVGRLRRVFNDELFRREGVTMVPTPRALELAAVVSKALATIRAAVDQNINFEPASSVRNFRIGLSDYTALTFLPGLIRKFSVEAPGATLNILHARETEIVDRLRNRDVECVILGNPSLNDPHLEKHVLIADRMVCAGWSGNPSLVDMSRAKYLAADHLQISADGQAEGATDLALREMNLSRRVVATVPHYLVAPWIIRGTSLITTFGDSVLLALTPESETVIFDPPIPLPDVLLTLIYERYLDADPGHVWLRELIGTVAREVQYAKARVAPALQRS